MLNATTFAGLDVHARSIEAVSVDVMTGATWPASVIEVDPHTLDEG